LNKTVLIVGGYGVFGGRLALALSKNETLEIVVAGRDRKKAEAFCRGTPCRPLHLDRNAPDIIETLKHLSPFILIDAAGPFQKYGEHAYSLAETAMEAGAHYMDLSDDAEFTAGIIDLDERAKARKLVVLSGVSSVPALSSAVVSTLIAGMTDVHSIESAILPGNRAPRGLSVIKAIVSQAGNPLSIWRGGQYQQVPGWSGAKTFKVKDKSGKKAIRRVGSFIGAPDLRLFPQRYRARNVSFRAGLDLRIMHRGLWLLSLMVRGRLMKSLLPLAVPLKTIAQGLKHFGSETGAMVVEATGTTTKGTHVQKRWELIVKQGDGPNIPTIPAQILVPKLITGPVSPGARPSLEEFSLNEAEQALQTLSVETSTDEQAVPLVFQSVLADDFARLLPVHQDLHTVLAYRRWTGRASVQRGRNPLSLLAGAIAGFPRANDDIDVQVEMNRTQNGETWTRTFGTKRFRSYLSSAAQDHKINLYERFGAMKFQIGLELKDGKLHFPVSNGMFFGVPLPKMLLPLSDAQEFVDEDGRARFHINVSLPICGHVATYSGWLEPADEI
jgi:saccharopine dehydrogenase-like NADP-dependent oxidoreductase